MKKGGGRGKSRGQRGKVWCGCITESQEEEDEYSTGLCSSVLSYSRATMSYMMY